jgi:hypothetical protein
MVDYSEGCLSLKKKAHQIYDLLVHERYQEAKEMCIEVIADARLLSAQIELQRKD